jgi:hypothetical protein
VRRAGKNWRRKGKTSDEEVVAGKDGCGEDEEEGEEESDSNGHSTISLQLLCRREWEIQISHRKQPTPSPPHNR